ncbi:hypothetical protein [Pyxidicoccus trucidator]|uniref:hypothetical protein n=1 Tax=Pyxidicoccus trucidator TaxID=2709662 RepID=UPI0013DAB704|nr:hypothetical protein [Pyxidicoccus trucidator]
MTRELWFKITTARRELDPEGRFSHPVPQADNLPDPDATEVQSHEFKKPDFQWIHDDDSEADERYIQKSFAIECKRLGAPTKSRWRLNEQYVVGGMNRFRDPRWKYGRGMAEGAMIGFIQNMEFEAISSAIDSDSKRIGFDRISRDPRGWQERSVSRLGNSFRREFPITPFRLFHLWLDIRDVPLKAKRSVHPAPKCAPKRRRTPR